MVFGYGAGVTTGMSVISLVIVVVLIASLLLPKKIHYGFNGVMLMVLGILPILNDMRAIRFNIRQIPVVNYVITFIIIIAGREMIKEGFHGEKGAVKYIGVALGITIIILTTIPTLYQMGAIGFTIPFLPQIMYHILYIAAGIFLIIGIFTLEKGV